MRHFISTGWLLLAVGLVHGGGLVWPTMSFADSSLVDFIRSEQRSRVPLSASQSVGTENPKAWLVFFLSSKCPCSIGHEPRIREIVKKYAGPELAVLGVNANRDETSESATQHFMAAGLPFPVLRDEQGKWLEKLPALKTPHVFLVAAQDGAILYQGGIDDSTSPDMAKRIYLDEALSDFRAGKEIRTPKSRSLGCQIRRSL